MSDSDRAQQLGLSPGDTVWILGHSDEENALLDPVSSGVEIIDHRVRETDDEDADEYDFIYENDGEDDDREPSAALVVVDDAVSLADDLDEALPRVNGIDLVWIAIPRRIRGVDPESVAPIVADYGWTVGRRVDLDDAWTAMQVELA